VIALLAARTSEYQLLKLRILDYVPISRDAAHVYVGTACLKDFVNTNLLPFILETVSRLGLIRK
jgi:hypothetical protein